MYSEADSHHTKYQVESPLQEGENCESVNSKTMQSLADCSLKFTSPVTHFTLIYRHACSPYYGHNQEYTRS